MSNLQAVRKALVDAYHDEYLRHVKVVDTTICDDDSKSNKEKPNKLPVAPNAAASTTFPLENVEGMFPFVSVPAIQLIGGALAVGCVCLQASSMIPLYSENIYIIPSLLRAHHIAAVSRALEMTGWSAFVVTAAATLKTFRASATPPPLQLPRLQADSTHNKEQEEEKKEEQEEKRREQQQEQPDNIDSSLLSLSDSVLLRCFSFLTPRELAVLATTSKYLHFAVSTPNLVERSCWQALRLASGHGRDFALLHKCCKNTPFEVFLEHKTANGAAVVVPDERLVDAWEEDEAGESVYVPKVGTTQDVTTWRLRSIRMHTLRSTYRKIASTLAASSHHSSLSSLGGGNCDATSLMLSEAKEFVMQFHEGGAVVHTYVCMFMILWFCASVGTFIDTEKPAREGIPGYFEAERGGTEEVSAVASDDAVASDYQWLYFLWNMFCICFGAGFVFLWELAVVAYDHWLILVVGTRLYNSVSGHHGHWTWIHAFSNMTSFRAAAGCVALRVLLCVLWRPYGWLYWSSTMLHAAMLLVPAWAVLHLVRTDVLRVHWAAWLWLLVAVMCVALEIDGIWMDGVQDGEYNPNERWLTTNLVFLLMSHYWSIWWEMAQIAILVHLGQGMLQATWLYLGYTLPAENALLSSVLYILKDDAEKGNLSSTLDKDRILWLVGNDYGNRMIADVVERQGSWRAWGRFLGLHLGAFALLQVGKVLTVPAMHRLDFAMLMLVMRIFLQFLPLVSLCFLGGAAWAILASMALYPEFVRRELWYGGILAVAERVFRRHLQPMRLRSARTGHASTFAPSDGDLQAHWTEYKRMRASPEDWEQDVYSGLQALMQPAPHPCLRSALLHKQLRSSSSSSGSATTTTAAAKKSEGAANSSSSEWTMQRWRVLQQCACREFGIAERAVDGALRLCAAYLLGPRLALSLMSLCLQLPLVYSERHRSPPEAAVFAAGEFTEQSVLYVVQIVMELSVLVAMVVVSWSVVVQVPSSSGGRGKLVVGRWQLRLLGKVLLMSLVFGLLHPYALAFRTIGLLGLLLGALAVARVFFLLATGLRVTERPEKLWGLRILKQPWFGGKCYRVAVLIGMELVYWSCIWLHWTFSASSSQLEQKWPENPNYTGVHILLVVIMVCCEIVAVLGIVAYSVCFCLPASNRRVVFG